jgi:hypothetical protein
MVLTIVGRTTHDERIEIPITGATDGVLYDVGQCVVFRHQLAVLHTKVAWAYAGMAIRPIGSPDRNEVSGPACVSG